MFYGLTSIGNNLTHNEFEEAQVGAQESILADQNEANEKKLKDLRVSLTELTDRVGAVEDELPEPKEKTTDDVPIELLATTATLAEVISAVNELIKRDFNKL